MNQREAAARDVEHAHRTIPGDGHLVTGAVKHGVKSIRDRGCQRDRAVALERNSSSTCQRRAQSRLRCGCDSASSPDGHGQQHQQPGYARDLPQPDGIARTFRFDRRKYQAIS
jgi:hypothetical protein